MRRNAQSFASSLASILFVVRTPLASCSAGQSGRLSLQSQLLQARRPNLIAADAPTEHLDLLALRSPFSLIAQPRARQCGRPSPPKGTALSAFASSQSIILPLRRVTHCLTRSSSSDANWRRLELRLLITHELVQYRLAAPELRAEGARQKVPRGSVSSQTISAAIRQSLFAGCRTAPGGRRGCARSSRVRSSPAAARPSADHTELNVMQPGLR